MTLEPLTHTICEEDPVFRGVLESGRWSTFYTISGRGMQGYLAHKKLHPPRTLLQDHAEGPRWVLGGVVVFLWAR